MSPEQWKQLERIYNEALEYRSEERTSFLAKVCGGDKELQREIESLLQANAGQFLERPAVELAAEAMARSILASRAERLQPGTKLGPYQIAAQLGKGGMGEVYRATDIRLDRAVAVKVLLDVVASDPQGLDRFEREARAISRLNHPHICTLHDVGEQDGIYYLVMELVEGETLASRLKKGRLALDQSLEYTAQIAAALDEAHQHGVVHRDLKPDNIMITKSGVKVLDFGLAKLKGDTGELSGMPQISSEGKPLTAQGTILGTLQYMAPEQLEGKDSDARTDVFAFGAIVYEMVTGEKAFTGKSQAGLIAAIMSQEPPPMAGHGTIVSPLDHIVGRCLKKNPNDRWQSAGDLMREVRRLTPTHHSPRPVPRRTRFGKRALAFTAFLIVVALASGATWWRRPDLQHFLSDPANVQRPAEFWEGWRHSAHIEGAATDSTKLVSAVIPPWIAARVRPEWEDLRVVDDAGREVPYVLSARQEQRKDSQQRGLQVSAFTTSRRIYFRKEPGRTYKVLYDNTDASATQYSLARLLDPTEFDSALPVGIGVESAVTAEMTVTPWTERHGLVLWVAVGLAVATLGTLAIRAMQK